MNMTMRQLEVFAAVAASEHVGRAAESLNVSQSAVSIVLADFEDTVGERVFDRIGRRLKLNDRGRALLPKVLSVLEQVRDIEEEGSGADGTLTGHIRTGASTTIGNYLLPGIIGAFAAKEPGVRVSLEVENTARIAAQVARHDIDVAFVEGPVSLPDMIVMPWRRDELIGFAAADAPDTAPETAAWIMREPGSGTREVFERAMMQAGVPMSVKMELGHTEAIKKAVEAGLGCGCLSRLTVERELRLGTVKEIPLPGVDLSRTLSIIMHRQKHVSRALGAFLEFCKGERPAPDDLRRGDVIY